MRRLVAAPGNPTRLYAVTTDSRFARSDDGGATWTSVPVAATGATALSGMGIDYRYPKTLYLTTDKGVFRTEDEGQTWGKVSGEFRQDITVSFDDSQVLWSVATTGSGFFFSNSQIMRSSDGGQSWRGASDGIYQPQVNSFILIDPQDTNALFVTATIAERATATGSRLSRCRATAVSSATALPGRRSTARCTPAP